MNRAGRRLLLLGWMHAYTYSFFYQKLIHVMEAQGRQRFNLLSRDELKDI
jgi:hypothetical protein